MFIYSRVWHQMFRKVLTDHADFITKQLRLPESIFTSPFKFFFSFFLSGLIHHTGKYIIYKSWTGHSIVEFFLLQAVAKLAITCEDIILALAARTRSSLNANSFFKIMGFVWALAWFTYSLPMWLNETIHSWISGVPVIRRDMQSVLTKLNYLANLIMRHIFNFAVLRELICATFHMQHTMPYTVRIM